MGFAILSAASKSVQSVTEFVEQRLGVVERKQRRLAVARLGEVHDIDDQRTDIALELFPVAQPGHPGAAVLRRAGKIIAEEKSAMTSGGVPHLPHPHVVMSDRDVVATPKCALRDFEPCDGLPPRCRIDGISRLQYNSHMLFGAPRSAGRMKVATKELLRRRRRTGSRRRMPWE